jgi:hypothetical protein
MLGEPCDYLLDEGAIAAEGLGKILACSRRCNHGQKWQRQKQGTQAGMQSSLINTQQNLGTSQKAKPPLGERGFYENEKV